jgi:hypothetical protein
MGLFQIFSADLQRLGYDDLFAGSIPGGHHPGCQCFAHISAANDGDSTAHLRNSLKYLRPTGIPLTKGEPTGINRTRQILVKRPPIPPIMPWTKIPLNSKS